MFSDQNTKILGQKLLRSAIGKGYMHKLPLWTFWVAFRVMFTTVVPFLIQKGKTGPQRCPKWPEKRSESLPKSIELPPRRTTDVHVSEQLIPPKKMGRDWRPGRTVVNNELQMVSGLPAWLARLPPPLAVAAAAAAAANNVIYEDTTITCVCALLSGTHVGHVGRLCTSTG